MKVTLKHLFYAFLLVAATTAFSSCNTARGFGQDMQKLGHEIEEEADEFSY